MRARTRRGNIRFCRRIGERGQAPRPIVIGLETEEEKRHLLFKARDLQGTRFRDVSLVLDLTKKQREVENRMQVEASERNKTLTDADRESGLRWQVVGRRGEKRIIKAVERELWNGDQQWRYQNTRGGEERRPQVQQQNRFNNQQYPALPRPQSQSQGPVVAQPLSQSRGGANQNYGQHHPAYSQPPSQPQRQVAAQLPSQVAQPPSQGWGGASQNNRQQPPAHIQPATQFQGPELAQPPSQSWGSAGSQIHDQNQYISGAIPRTSNMPYGQQSYGNTTNNMGRFYQADSRGPENTNNSGRGQQENGQNYHEENYGNSSRQRLGSKRTRDNDSMEVVEGEETGESGPVRNRPRY